MCNGEGQTDKRTHRELVYDANLDNFVFLCVLSYYNNLIHCVENVGKITACYEPSLTNEIFLDIHRTYFFHCHFLKDPDMPVLLLYFLPCVIITFLFPFICSYVTTSDMASCVYD